MVDVEMFLACVQALTYEISVETDELYNYNVSLLCHLGFIIIKCLTSELNSAAFQIPTCEMSRISDDFQQL